MSESVTLSVTYQTVARFLEAAGGNYRNALYITCSHCSHTRESGCRDYLCIPGEDGFPVLLPIKDAEIFFGFAPDRSECSAVIDNHTFCQLYQLWIRLHLADSRSCPFHQILELQNRSNP